MLYRSKTWAVDVREEVAREFTRSDGTVDDALAGLHEIRQRLLDAGDDVATGGTQPVAKSESKGG